MIAPVKLITGWWLTYPSANYESQMGLLFPIYGKIKNVPNHQPNNILQLVGGWATHIIISKHQVLSSNVMECHRFPGWWFQPTPLKNMSSSVGMVIPIYHGKKYVPNHQPDIIRCLLYIKRLSMWSKTICNRFFQSWDGFLSSAMIDSSLNKTVGTSLVMVSA